MTDSDNEKKNSRSLVLSRSTVIAFFVGVVVPLLAAVVPQGIEYLKTKNDFTYFRGDPVFFDTQVAYSIQINNKGRVVEKDVQLWIGNLSGSEVSIERDIFGDRLQELKTRDEEGKKVVSIGDMRPGDEVRVSILRIYKTRPSVSKDSDGALISYPGFVDKVVSTERVAAFVPKEGTVWEQTSSGYLRTSIVAAIVALLLAYASLIVARSSTRKHGTDSTESNRNA